MLYVLLSTVMWYVFSYVFNLSDHIVISDLQCMS